MLTIVGLTDYIHDYFWTKWCQNKQQNFLPKHIRVEESIEIIPKKINECK